MVNQTDLPIPKRQNVKETVYTIPEVALREEKNTDNKMYANPRYLTGI